MRIAVVALVFLAGCPICDCSADIEVISDEGWHPLRPGEDVQFRAHSEGWVSGPNDCGGSWAINGIVGGSAELGKIDPCGFYRAPATFPPQLIELRVEAANWDLAAPACADCCPYATRAFPIVRADAP